MNMIIIYKSDNSIRKWIKQKNEECKNEHKKYNKTIYLRIYLRIDCSDWQIDETMCWPGYERKGNLNFWLGASKWQTFLEGIQPTNKISICWDYFMVTIRPWRIGKDEKHRCLLKL